MYMWTSSVYRSVELEGFVKGRWDDRFFGRI